jgi:hypothetical protein
VKGAFAKKFLVPGEIRLAARSPRFFGNTLLKAGHLIKRKISLHLRARRTRPLGRLI